MLTKKKEYNFRLFICGYVCMLKHSSWNLTLLILSIWCQDIFPNIIRKHNPSTFYANFFYEEISLYSYHIYLLN